MAKPYRKQKAKLEFRQRKWDEMKENVKSATTRPGSMNRKRG